MTPYVTSLGRGASVRRDGPTKRAARLVPRWHDSACYIRSNRFVVKGRSAI